jgi:hypothetical protein
MLRRDLEFEQVFVTQLSDVKSLRTTGLPSGQAYWRGNIGMTGPQVSSAATLKVAASAKVNFIILEILV